MESTRRDFLKGAGLTALGVGAAAMVGCSPQSSASTEASADTTASTSSWRTAPAAVTATQTKQADYIVVGTSHSGAAVLRSIAEDSSYTVIGIEKQARDSFMTMGNDIGHFNSQFLRDHGVEDVDPVDMYNDWMHRSLNEANPSLVMQFCQNAGANVDWWLEPFADDVVSQLGVPFIPKTTNQLSEVAGYEFKGGTMRVTVDDTSSLSLSTMQQTIYDTILSHSTAQIDFSMTATQLIKSGDKVTGVMATDADGNVVEYDATKGVILAAGGFGANADMKNDLLTHITDCFQDGRDEWGMAMDQDGAGISMGVWAGGRLEPRPLATMNGDFAKGSFPQAIWLDENGERYCNEYFGDVTLAGKPQARMAHVWLWSICDSRLPEYSDYCIPAHDAYEPATDAATRAATFAAAIGTGSEGYTEVVAGPPGAPVTEADPNDPPTCYCGNTIDELIANAGWDAEYGANVKASVERWNTLCAEKKDEDFGKDPEVMFPIETGPFYAFSYDASAVGGLMVTLGGLLTDKNQEVLDEQCEPISGLYATGNCCGRRFGYGYFTQVCGESLGMAIVLGRQLGKYLAAL